MKSIGILLNWAFAITVALGSLGVIALLPAITTVWLWFVGIVSIVLLLSIILILVGISSTSLEKRIAVSNNARNMYTPGKMLVYTVSVILTGYTLLLVNAPFLFILYIIAATSAHMTMSKLVIIKPKD